jgi:hypothetical protein
MAYTPNTLAQRAYGMVEGLFGVWEYVTTDTPAQYLAPGYFSDGSSKGMEVGDLVWVINKTAITAVRCICTAATVTTSGGLTQTVGSSTIALSLDSNAGAFPTNLLMGGDATTNPWQRGTTISAIVATNTYTADRWFMVAGAATSANMTKTADTTVSGFGQAFVWGRASGQSSVSSIVLGQVLESLDSIRLQSQPLALSFWAKTQSGYTGGSLAVRVGQGTGTDQSASSFVNTSWTGYSDVISTTQVLTSSYVRYSFLGSVASNATQVGVSFAFTPVGTNTGNDAISMIGIQLQQGGVSPFEHRAEQVELALCQRYFYQLNEPATGIAVAVGAVGAANATQFVIPLPVQMRAAPTVTTNSGQFVQSVSGAQAAVSAFTSSVSGSTVNYVSVLTTATATAGLSAVLIGKVANSGFVAASADL